MYTSKLQTCPTESRSVWILGWIHWKKWPWLELCLSLGGECGPWDSLSISCSALKYTGKYCLLMSGIVTFWIHTVSFYLHNMYLAHLVAWIIHENTSSKSLKTNVKCQKMSAPNMMHQKLTMKLWEGEASKRTGGCLFLCLSIQFIVPPQEDFQAMTYGFKMANNVTDLRVTGKK